MAKVKSMWFCNSCGADTPKWEGRCPSCGEWGTLVEEKVSAKQSKGSKSTRVAKSVPQKVSEIKAMNEPRIHMPSEELNRVLGGGLVAGSLVLIGGEPGIGKSTLLRTISGVQPALRGTIEINGRDLTDYSSKELSKLIGIVYTDRTLAGALTVEELVSLGRQPYTGFFGRLDADDRQVVADAIESVGMSHKTHDYVATLSDGERQKAMIARALAQETPIIILDEPTAFLDVASRIETMQLLRQLAQSQQKAVLLSTHDVGLSLPLTVRLWLVTADSTVVEGTTSQFISDGTLNNLFPGRNIAFDSSVMDFRVKD